MKVEKKVLNEALRRISGGELRGGGSCDRFYDLPVSPAGRFFSFDLFHLSDLQDFHIISDQF